MSELVLPQISDETVERACLRAVYYKSVDRVNDLISRATGIALLGGEKLSEQFLPRETLDVLLDMTDEFRESLEWLGAL